MRLNEDKTVDADDSLEAEPSEEFEVLDNDEAGVENDDSQSNSVVTSQNKRSKQTPFELVLFHRIYNHVAHMTSFFQHGFQARRSTVTNLLSVTHFLQVNLDARKQIDVIYMDFSKAGHYYQV
jgi:citrate lyase alpha subunit